MTAAHGPDFSNWSFSIDLDETTNSCTPQNQPCTAEAIPPRQVVEQFRRDGFVALSHVLRPATVQALNKRLEDVLRGQYDRGTPPDKVPVTTRTSASCETPAAANAPLVWDHKNSKKVVWQIVNIHKADHLFRQLACSAALGRVVAELADWNTGTRLAQDQIWAKPPGAPPLTFHRDAPYFMFTPEHAVMTVWIALDDMDAEIGPLEYVRKSHLWATNDDHAGTARQFFSGGMDLLRSTAVSAGALTQESATTKTDQEIRQTRQLDIVSMAGLRAGGISIHDGRTWHGSGRNTSATRPRRGLGIHFVPKEARFTPRAVKSRLWRPYVEGMDGSAIAELDLPIEDFPVTWQS
jgi:phytanoyl-CoA hydroxylase